MEKVKVIQQRLETAQSRYKSYVDIRKRGLKFSIGDWVFFKVSPMKGKLRNKEVAYVKVLWRNQQVEEVTWEA